MIAIEVTTKQTVTEERVQDLLCCALEGGSNYWYTIVEKCYPEGQTKESLGIVYPHLELPFKGGCLVISDGDPGTDNQTLDLAAIKRGLQLLADKYPKHWSDFMQENEDADTGDVFLQLALFGEVIFG